MILSRKNIILNTIIVFILLMSILYHTKPSLIYDHTTHKFKKFGTSKNETIIPIHVIGILLVMVLYMLFFIWNNNKPMNDNIPTIEHNKNIINHNNDYHLMIQQMQNLQTQLQQLYLYQLHNKQNSDISLPNILNV